MMMLLVFLRIFISHETK